MSKGKSMVHSGWNLPSDTEADRIEQLIKGLAVHVGQKAYAANGLHFNKEDRTIAASVKPLTIQEATQAIHKELTKARLAEAKTLYKMFDKYTWGAYDHHSIFQDRIKQLGDATKGEK